MAHPPELRAKVRASYVYERLSLEAAAEKHGVSYPTVRRWKSEAENDGDDWERGRSAARLASDGVRNVVQMMLEDYLQLHQATVEAVKGDAKLGPLAKAEVLSRLADAFTKTMAAVGKASPELSRLAVATDVLQRFAKYIAEEAPHLAEGLLEVIEPFAADLAKDYG